MSAPNYPFDLSNTALLYGRGSRVVIVEADNGSGDTSHALSALMHGKGFTLNSRAGSNMIFVRVADQALIW